MSEAEAASVAAEQALTVEDVSHDGGVLKEILKDGEGWEKPSNGSDVWVHYTGTLTDGSKFDSSRDRNQEFKFTLGAGQVIKGWDTAVATMLKGEVCKVTLKPDYAYGARGSPPKIPPNAALIFEIELIRFRSDKDLTEDGGVVKRTTKPPTDPHSPSPSYESEVGVRLLGKLDDGTVVQNETLAFVLGDIDLPKGIEKAIESLKCGEIAQFDIQSEYGYGAHGNAAMKIPPNATLRYEMELSKVVSQKDSWDYNTFAEKLQAGIQRKTDGNAYFSAKRFNQAVRKYQRGLDFIDSKYDASEEEKKQAEELEKTLTLNMAQCYINLREWKKAIESCNKVFETDKSNPKAQFRRAVAYSGLDDWTRATADFDRALELTPGDSAVIAEYNKLKQKMRQQDLKEKKMYTNMFKQLSADQD